MKPGSPSRGAELSWTGEAELAGASWRFGVLVFGVALAVRVAALLLLRAPAEIDRTDPWGWGFEMANVARALAAGHGFADPWLRAAAPFDQPSGATGWLSPAYPALLAVLMRVLGGLTPAAAAALLGLQCVLSSLTTLLVWRIGRLAGHARAGRCAAWVLALHPYAIWNAAHTVWDTTLAAFALTLFVACALGWMRRPSTLHRLALGAAFGALLLVHAAALAWAPLLLVWVAYPAPNVRAACARAGLVCVAALAVVSPWLVRNRLALGSAALRTNLGVELAVGNFDGARGYFAPERHPSYSAREFERFRSLGEVRYASVREAEALDWMRAHPTEFAALTLRRAALYWLGDPPPLDPRVDDAGRHAAQDLPSWIKWLTQLASGAGGLAGLLLLARRGRAGLFVGLCALALCLPYCVTHVLERYRFPSEPLLVLGLATLLLALVGGHGRRVSSAHGS